MIRTPWPWIWTVLAWVLAVSPGIPDLLGGRLPDYSAELAVLTATLTAIIWYAAFTYESVVETRRLSEIRHRHDAAERFDNLNQIRAGFTFIRQPLERLRDRGGTVPFDKTRQQTVENRTGLPAGINHMSELQDWEDRWEELERAAAQVDVGLLSNMYGFRNVIERVWDARQEAVQVSEEESREEREVVADELVNAVREALRDLSDLEDRVAELREELISTAG